MLVNFKSFTQVHGTSTLVAFSLVMLVTKSRLVSEIFVHMLCRVYV